MRYPRQLLAVSPNVNDLLYTLLTHGRHRVNLSLKESILITVINSSMRYPRWGAWPVLVTLPEIGYS